MIMTSGAFGKAVSVRLDEKIEDFVLWAFGKVDDFPENCLMYERWNKLHGELFLLTEESVPGEELPRIVDAHTTYMGVA